MSIKVNFLLENLEKSTFMFNFAERFMWNEKKSIDRTVRNRRES